YRWRAPRGDLPPRLTGGDCLGRRRVGRCLVIRRHVDRRHDEDRPACVLKDVVGDAPEKRPDPGQAPSAEHDQVDVELGGVLDDRFGDLALVGYPDRARVEAELSGETGAVFRDPAGVLLGAVVLTAGVGGHRDWAAEARGAERLDDHRLPYGEHDCVGTVDIDELCGRGDRAVGALRPVVGKQDGHWYLLQALVTDNNVRFYATECAASGVLGRDMHNSVTGQSCPTTV